MANQNTAPVKQRAPKKLLLANLYTDAPVRTEPEEPPRLDTQKSCVQQGLLTYHFVTAASCLPDCKDR